MGHKCANSRVSAKVFYEISSWMLQFSLSTVETPIRSIHFRYLKHDFIICNSQKFSFNKTPYLKISRKEKLTTKYYRSPNSINGSRICILYQNSITETHFKRAEFLFFWETLAASSNNMTLYFKILYKSLITITHF